MLVLTGFVAKHGCESFDTSWTAGVLELVGSALTDADDVGVISIC